MLNNERCKGDIVLFIQNGGNVDRKNGDLRVKL